MKIGLNPWNSNITRWSDYPEKSMFDFLSATATEYPDYTAIEFYGRKISYSELVNNSIKFAKVLISLGVGRGDFVSIVCPNIPQAVMAVYAANRIGAVANMLHPLLSRDELYYAITSVKSKVVVILDQLYSKLKMMPLDDGSVFIIVRICDYLPFNKYVPYLLKNTDRLETNHKHRIFFWKKLISDNYPELEADTGKGTDTAVILYSGGTSGKPKGIELTNNNFNYLAVQTIIVYGDDRIQGMHTLALMPVFHGFGLGVSIHAMLVGACHIFLVPVYDMNDTARLIFKRKISFIYGVPALYEALSRSVEIEKYSCCFIKGLVSAGDCLSPKLEKRFNEQLKKGGSKAEIRVAYGETETTSGCTINPYFAMKENSIGIPFPDMMVQICDHETGAELPRGKVGEICVYGPTVMKGYLNEPSATAEVMRRHSDGLIWLHTNDLGYEDDDGYFYFVQRLNRMIITGGYNIYPNDIEKIICECESVKQACVVGKKDTAIGEYVCAYVVPVYKNYDTEQICAEIRKKCEDKIPQFAMPREVVILSELPVTRLNKIDFQRLMDM